MHRSSCTRFGFGYNVSEHGSVHCADRTVAIGSQPIIGKLDNQLHIHEPSTWKVRSIVVKPFLNMQRSRIQMTDGAGGCSVTWEVVSWCYEIMGAVLLLCGAEVVHDSGSLELCLQDKQSLQNVRCHPLKSFHNILGRV